MIPTPEFHPASVVATILTRAVHDIATTYDEHTITSHTGSHLNKADQDATLYGLRHLKAEFVVDEATGTVTITFRTRR